MSWLAILPVVVPMLTAIATLLVRRQRQLERVTSLAGALALLGVAVALTSGVWRQGIIVAYMGDWSPPFGITMVVDHLSAVMVLITGIVAVAVVVYSVGDIDDDRERLGFQSFLHLLLAGVCGAFVTGDLFNLYVWFEVMLIASFALLVLGGEPAQIDGAVKYVAINLVSTLLFLTAVALLYGLTGTLNMAELHVKVPLVENQGALAAVVVLFMIAFGIKAAVFPLFFWLPASYHTPPIAISALFSALLTKVGVYALIRTFTLIFTHDVGFSHQIILVIAALTMIIGVLGAAAQNDIRRILSFHIISQIGYMILGLALFTPLGLLGAVFYLVHHIIVKANLFLIAGVAGRLGGSFDIKALGGLYDRYPWLAVLFLIPALSLAGLPPLSGFWAKLVLIQASLETEAYAIAAVTLVVGLLTLYSMSKIWMQAFWKPQPAESAAAVDGAIGRPVLAVMVAPIVVLALMTVVIGLWAEPFVTFAARAADELMSPAAYVRAVLGTTP